MSDAQFQWGDKVVVATSPGPERAAWVCGRREQEGDWLYIVEYEDGSSEEVPQSVLRRS